jgi:hypothetical protein
MVPCSVWDRFFEPQFLIDFVSEPQFLIDFVSFKRARSSLSIFLMSKFLDGGDPLYYPIMS